MVARLGSVELSVICNYLGIITPPESITDIVNFIKGKRSEWWWGNQDWFQTNAGFFSNTIENRIKFCKMMLDDMTLVDVLGSWRKQEFFVKDRLKNSKKTALAFLEPFWADEPWSESLRGKKVLVVHPFAKLIEEQYKKREFLFKDSRILPKFELQTIKAVQTIGGENAGFGTWFDALDYMKAEMDKYDYDIALIGCGAYGFPLAAHAKCNGKIGIHLGGSLQLLFGIKGKRWENPNLASATLGGKGKYLNLFNDAWVYPDKTLRPKAFKNVEDGCYW